MVLGAYSQCRGTGGRGGIGQRNHDVVDDEVILSKLVLSQTASRFPVYRNKIMLGRPTHYQIHPLSFLMLLPQQSPFHDFLEPESLCV